MVNSESFWLRSAVLKYISENNGKVNSVNIAMNFKVQANLTLNEVAALEDDGKIHKTRDGRYEVNNNDIVQV